MSCAPCIRSFLLCHPNSGFLRDHHFYFKFISKLVDQIFNERLLRDRKERQLAPQASAGDSASINPLLVFRKAQRGREKIASKK